jgi:ATP-dependent Clp protease ATP-binding subunit ClpC
MLDRFDTGARRSIATARDVAAGNAIDPGHMLVALAQVAGDGARLLARHGATADVLAAGSRPDPTGAHVGPFSKAGRKALEAALASAAMNGRDSSTQIDILVGVLGGGESSEAVVLLRSVGCDADAILADARSAAADGIPGAWGGPELDPDPEPVGARGVKKRGKKNRKALEAFGTNLTELARQGRLDPVIGREREIEQVIVTLGRRSKSNPVLVGPAGAGKTAIMEGLAQRIADGTVPENLRDVQLWSLDMSGMLAGTRYRGDFEERLKDVIKEASQPDIVLCIDEVHSVLGAGSSQHGGGMGTADMLKPAMSRGEIRILGATTTEEYRYIERDAALERRFTPVNVAPFDVDAAVVVLSKLAPTLAEHHKVDITDDAVPAAVRLAHRFLVDRNLPDSAIDVLDEAGAYLAVQRSLGRDVGTTVSAQTVADTVAAMTGIASGTLTEERADRLVHLTEMLQTRIVGQDEAVEAVARAAQRAGAGLRDISRPVANFLFCGPTGVGKTLTATTLAEAFFGDADAITVFDMSEFAEEHTVAQLLGAPPGYVGHDEGGRLPLAIRRRRAQVLLFDEVEKAHPRVFDSLMALLDEGRVSGADGQTADATECVIVMTSNLGTAQLRRPTVGFKAGVNADDRQVRESTVDGALREFFRPEFLNRIDTTVVFAPLGRRELRTIAGLELGHLDARLRELGSGLVVGDGVTDVLAAAAASENGARGVKRTIVAMVENPVVDLRLMGQLDAGWVAEVRVAGNGSLNVTPTLETTETFESESPLLEA